MSTNEAFKYRVCVSECPANLTVDTLACLPNSVVTSCRGVVSEEQPKAGSKELHIYPSHAVATICFPQSAVADGILKSILGKESGSNVLGDTA
jgi:hypothetical protein